MFSKGIEMMGLTSKKTGTNRSQREGEEERVSLIERGGDNSSNRRRRSGADDNEIPTTIFTSTKSALQSASSRGIEMMKMYNKNKVYSADKSRAKKRANARQFEEERVSLLGSDGQPGAPRMVKRKRRPKPNPKPRELPWTLTRMMRYMSLTVASALITFLILRKENQVLHWEEMNSLLEPEAAKNERCYTVDRNGKDERCTCPDPSNPLAPMGALIEPWLSHHYNMVQDAKNAPKKLDIVFLGDSITERWNGTAGLGLQTFPGMRKAFEDRFTKKGGGQYEGIALGSAGDTGPNMLWHLHNGLLESLDPKIWFIHIGANDLFTGKCIDRFVIASILNVLKTIQEQRPKAMFVIHGILPRKENPKSKSPFLGKRWKRAQNINLALRKFSEHFVNIHYIQGGALFMDESDMRGRRKMNFTRMEDGIHPTTVGLELWGDYIIKRLDRIETGMKELRKRAKVTTQIGINQESKNPGD